MTIHDLKCYSCAAPAHLETVDNTPIYQNGDVMHPATLICNCGDRTAVVLFLNRIYKSAIGTYRFIGGPNEWWQEVILPKPKIKALDYNFEICRPQAPWKL